MEVLRDNQRWLDRNSLDVCLRLKMRTRLSGFQLLPLQHWAQKDPAELNAFPESYPESHSFV